MKLKRQKKAQRILGFFQHNFGLKPPYNILLDGTFCSAALEAKVNIKEQVPKYIGAQVFLVTTQCVIIEVEQLSKMCPQLYGAWLVVKQFAVHKCGHEGRPMAASSCIKGLIKKKNLNKYIIATQDADLRQHIHEKVIATPILYLHHSAPTLEKPSARCEETAKDKIKSISTHEVSTLKTLKRAYVGEKEQQPKKKRKKKNPNPLSCKKSTKKKEKTESQTEEKVLKKRKRHKRKKAGDGVEGNTVVS
ncbi:rRNA-processing protein UTP23 homolog [Oratosquilla oratoria]|uniref:rRNA-processing protein UTP23 homolog n=1 Tax=Oratosquilla oratoria TaxID=337810 RepID=UPI003F765C03